jgi:hypothetical protein
MLMEPGKSLAFPAAVNDRCRMSDRFGVPDNMFGPVPEDFYALVGRIALVATLVEDRMLGVLWALDDQPQETYAGLPAFEISGQIDKRLHLVDNALGARVRAALIRAKGAMDKRSAVVHSLWPNPGLEVAQGWRSRRLPKSLGGGSEIVWTPASEQTLAADIAELVDLSTELMQIVNQIPSVRYATHQP